MAQNYPPVGFHFLVDFSEISDNELDIRFQSVSGLTVEVEHSFHKEGGENRFQHCLPTESKFQNLILKRGMVTDSALIKWCRATFEDFEFRPIDLTVSLLNPEHMPLRTWSIVHAWPIKWSISNFEAQQDNLVIETLELRYEFFRLIEN